MNLFIQGMRRSGTTILYDALQADPELRCFYEPLREQDVTEGGGSGAREGDAFAETREIREQFQQERYPDISIDEFNWGGPRDPAVEADDHLPEHAKELLRHLLTLAPAVAIKETRLYRKVADVHDLDPDAAFVHVVRDPRAVAASIILGRRRKRIETYDSPADIFKERTDRKLWSSRAIAQALLDRDGRSGEEPSDVERILMVWKLAFEGAYEDGRRLYGDRYLLLRNEDLRSDTPGALDAVYRVLGRETPAEVREWAAQAVRGAEDVYAADQAEWADLFRRYGLEDDLGAAGYAV
jgi:sulfotransferase family protein